MKSVFLNLNYPYVTDFMEGEIYAPQNVYSRRQGLFYKNTTGSNQTVVFDRIAAGEPSITKRVVGFVITSPSGVGMIGDIIVAPLNYPSGWGSDVTLPRYTPEGLSDRRVYYPLQFSNPRGMRVTVSPGSEISRIIPIYEEGFVDTSDCLGGNWKLKLEYLNKNSMGAGADYFWDTNQQSSLIQFKRIDFRMMSEQTSFNFLNCFYSQGFHKEVMIIPNWEDYDGSASKLKLMYSTSVFGRFSKNYEQTLVGDKNGSNNVFDITLQIKELI